MNIVLHNPQQGHEALFRHPKSGKAILNEPVCTDDFGNLVFVCHYTKCYVGVDAAIFIGPVMPQVNGTYVCATNAYAAYKSSTQNFNEMDANCNTCRKFIRLPHKKDKSGMLKGQCNLMPENPQAYMRNGDVYFVHPEDWMGMQCWEARA